MTFTADMNRIMDAYEKLLLAVARKAFLDMFRDLVMGTPVKTGRHRGNWQFSTGGPALNETGILDPSGGTAIQTGTVAISAARPGFWWATNNGPAIVQLEMGHSKQAPNGWVGAAANRFNNNVAAAAAALRRS